MKKILTSLVLFIMTTFLLVSQEKVYVPYFDVIGMHPDYQLSFTRLFKSYVDMEDRYSAIVPEIPASPVSLPSVEKARKVADSLGAPYFFLADMNRLSDVVVCTFTLYQTSSGEKIWSDVMKAMTPDDLDPILQNVARAMGTEESAKKAADIYSVTNYESRELNQLKSHYAYGISVGGAYPFFRNVESPFAAGFGLMASYDSRNLILDIKGEAYFNDADIYFLSLDALYPFSEKNSTPYALGGLGIGGMDVIFDDKDYEPLDIFADQGGGLMLFLGGGYIINRHSDVNLRLGGRAYIPFFQVRDQTAPGILLNVSIVFGK